jgi:hypothetical protein
MEFNDSNMETSYSCGVLPMKENVVEPLSEEAIPKETLNGQPFNPPTFKSPHWLFNRVDFKFEVKEESKCTECNHRFVCERKMEKAIEVNSTTLFKQPLSISLLGLN